jgi:hypothetical protein
VGGVGQVYNQTEVLLGSLNKTSAASFQVLPSIFKICLLAEKMIYDEIFSTSLIEQKGFDGTIELKRERRTVYGSLCCVL